MLAERRLIELYVKVTDFLAKTFDNRLICINNLFNYR